MAYLQGMQDAMAGGSHIDHSFYVGEYDTDGNNHQFQSQEQQVGFRSRWHRHATGDDDETSHANVPIKLSEDIANLEQEMEGGVFIYDDEEHPPAHGSRA